MKKYLSSSEWLIENKNRDFSVQQQLWETIFTLGNGYMGIRGVLEEIPDNNVPGTYIAGVFDKGVAQVEELINLPNALDFRVASEGEKLDVVKMQILRHCRTLDLKRGLLYRNTLFKDTRGRKIDYQSIRFVSLDNPHLIVMKVKLTAINSPVNLIIQDCIDDSIANRGGLLEGKKRHVKIIDLDTENQLHHLCVKSYTYNVWIAYSTLLSVKCRRKEYLSRLRTFPISLAKNESITITKYITIHTSRDTRRKRIKDTSCDCVMQAYRIGFDKLLSRHTKIWSKYWQDSDVEIVGDKDIQKALRFNIYHLLIAANPLDDDVSIGAKTLSGEGYRGHIFWDTEIFILPFFIYTRPEIARNLLLYRYKRLSKARKIAKEKGFKGVLFPWESAATGEETTPDYSKDLDGSIIEIHTHEMEHHISSDIAYAVYKYYTLTDDKNFMDKYGLEMIFETARFYASRVTYNRKKSRYEINNVIGPDEFHKAVNNNAYTNYMAKWNLLIAVRLYKEYEGKSKKVLRKLKSKLQINEKEVSNWLSIAGKIYLPISKRKNLIEEFERYFKKRSIAISEWERDFIPTVPKTIPLKKIGQTQFVKQADVVMLLFLFPQNFTFDEIKNNFCYYIKRTLHKSSLSPSVHATVASWLNDKVRAYIYFIYSAFADLQNKHGNTYDGIHAASLGGTYQSVISGFAGVNIDENGIWINPHLPTLWKQIKFKLKYQGKNITFKISQNRIELNVSTYDESKGVALPLRIKVCNKDYQLFPKKKLVVKIRPQER